MKNTWKMAPLFALALLAFGCGGGGSASPEGVGDSIVSAIRGENYADIYDSFVPWQEAAMQQDLDRELFRSENTKDWWKNNKDRLSSGGDNSLDPGKLLEISDKDDYFALSPAQRTALEDGWYKRAHKWEKFTERMEDLRLVDISARHGFEGDGSGSLTYENMYGDSLTVPITRVDGIWYATSVRIEGLEELPTAE